MSQSENPVESTRPLVKAPPGPAAPRPCILVVDDDSLIRAMLEAALEKYYSVICLCNGDHVPSLIELHAPRLLILDINIPGSDGYEICGKVRQQARSKKLPILFMTIRKDDGAFLKALEAGGDAVICKPFEMPALRERIDYLLGSYPSP